MKYLQLKISIVAICAFLVGMPTYAGNLNNQSITIPSGTMIPVRMIDSISSDRNQAGQTFRGSLSGPVRVNNHVVLPKGATAYITLVEARSAGKIKGRNELALRLDRIATPSGTYNVQSNVVAFRGSSQGKKTAKSAGIGGAIGLGAGALLGGGKGALIGGGLGAGAGVATRAFKDKRPIVVGSESQVNFRLVAPMHVRK